MSQNELPKKTTENLTRATLLNVVEDSDGFKLVCRWCKTEMRVPVPYYPQRQMNRTTGAMVTIKTKEKFMINFLEEHYGLHMRQANKPR